MEIKDENKLCDIMWQLICITNKEKKKKKKKYIPPLVLSEQIAFFGGKFH